MRNVIVYILMFIFLLFTAENKQTLDFQPDFGNQNISLHILSFAKKHHLNHSLEKASLQQMSDSLDSPEEMTLNFSDVLNFIAIAATFGIGYLLHLYFRRRNLKFYEAKGIFPSVKRFILLRTIRI
ncbi:hypothetical protein [Epilithonimonas arachidiradicis]|uniref:Uncharacterized protein n=1 Tax=Epilithonimonas arachidiradicis TaxID=1617282 RepID=A0A420DBM4_9FLAO|nr:hypothetical protein [Epilithonimonas arachidiradicis]RKE88956.1 hypothetical protein BXY58_1089 [Epilithonimonas arachidiradicis]